MAEKVVRRRLSALELAPAAVGRPVAQPTRVLEGWLLGSERGSAPVGAEKSSARRVGVFGLTHGSALAASGCPADLRSAGVCVARVDLRLWRPAEDSYLLGAGTGLELV